MAKTLFHACTVCPTHGKIKQVPLVDKGLLLHCSLMLLQYGTRPNELAVKKLAMLGCVALVLAHSVKDMKEQLQNNAYAGTNDCWRCS